MNNQKTTPTIRSLIKDERKWEIKSGYDKLSVELIDLRHKVLKLEFEMLSHTSPELGTIGYDIACLYAQQIEDAKARIAKIEAIAPCREFIEQFGYTAHDDYKVNHAINSNTKVQEISGFLSSPFYYSGNYVENWVEASPLPSAYAPPTYSCAVERWAYPDLSGDGLVHFRLAFAERINTVYFSRG